MPNIIWEENSIKNILVQIKIIRVKLRELYLQATTTMIMKKMFEKKIGN